MNKGWREEKTLEKTDSGEYFNVNKGGEGECLFWARI
jgi:hypothetical protein